jgi:uncharacterized membrane protein YcaP (DUF421 family)
MQLLEINLSFIHDPYVSIVLRALAVYVFIIVAIRVFGKKELAQLSVIDLVFILLISNSVQNAMVGPDTSLEGGLIAAAALFTVNFILKKVLYKNKTLSDLLQGEAIVLIYKGHVNKKNCQGSEITLDELTASVREHGAANIHDVDLAMLEVDGNISVISHNYTKHSVVGHPKKHKLKGRLFQK